MRLFIIGQQTDGWYKEQFVPECSDTPIRTFMKIYRDKFRLGLRRGGYFWRAVRILEARLGIEPGCVVWSNLNKVDQKKTGTRDRRPATDIEAGLTTLFPVLKQEIALTVPNVVFFFTGPLYDDLLKRIFPKAILSPIHDHDLGICCVEHPSLPKKTFRSYHPGFLHWDQPRRWEPVLAALAELARAS